VANLQTTNKSISSFIETIAKNGGMSYSNNFDVEFRLPSALASRMDSYGIKTSSGVLNSTNPTDTGAVVKLFCDEAQLPNIQAATGQITGRLLGEGQVNYPHTKLYSDFQMSWMCDANMTPLKFLEIWYGFIFQEFDTQDNKVSGNYFGSPKNLNDLKSGAGAGGGNANTPGSNNSPGSYARTVRLNYPNTYLSNILITKTEKSKNAPNGRASMCYNMIDCFPYSIDATPLSYGASQVTKVSANFYYARHFINYNNIRAYAG